MVFGGDDLDVSLLLMLEIGFIMGQDLCYCLIVVVIEMQLWQGYYLFCYKVFDDFGMLEIVFIVCIFWLIEVLSCFGCYDEVCEIFVEVLVQCMLLGFLFEGIYVFSKILWGNFLQIYFMVGLINVVWKLLWKWEDVV